MRFIATSSLLLCLALVFVALCNGQEVPALFIFGDSNVDVGNNNRLNTVIRANFLPYGRDFNNRMSTGRFCNGKIITDFLAEILGFSSYPPAYMSRQARGSALIVGANFASAGSGYYQQTADLYRSISLSTQVDNYKEYQGRLAEIIGAANATAAFSTGIHILSTGNTDFLQNYYVTPSLHRTYTPEQFSNILVQNYQKFVQDLYDSGARKIGVTSLPPIGCLPAAITLHGSGNNMCVDRLNHDAMSFNQKLNAISHRLQNRLTDLKLIVFDIYNALDNIIKNPSANGFEEARRGCCGTGLVETGFLCNPSVMGTCSNASEYVFWDAYHLSEATNSLLSLQLYDLGSPFLND